MTIFIYDKTNNEIISTLTNVESYTANKIIYKKEQLDPNTNTGKTVTVRLGGFSDDIEFAVGDTFEEAAKACRAACGS